MTTELRNRDEAGRFPAGVSGNPNGRPRKGNAIRDLLKRVPVSMKRELIEVAFQEAIQNKDVHWAEWIAKHSGESGSRETEVNIDNRSVNTILVRYVSGEDG